MKNAPLDVRWVTGDVLSGKYFYFALIAGYHLEIARSCYYDTAAEMNAAWEKTKNAFAPAPVAEAPKPQAEEDDYLPSAE